ncbi:MAG: HD-GYP domain-containing protein [Acetatifactor sp.]|nr:HD-GYP domain-containing protein [Acetatifactor sp.]
MVIDQAIIDRSGRILIARKTVLDAFLIDALQKMRITGIYIREGEEDPEIGGDIEVSPEVQKTIDKLMVEDRSKVKLSESVKKRVSEGIKFLYNDTSTPDFINTAANVTSSLVNSIMENEAVAINIDTLKFSDEYTFQHSVDVATISMLIAKNSNMSEREIQKIGMAGLLHDMGKSKIPNEILNKAGKLTEEEFAIMKNHSLYGYQILKEKGGIPQEVLMGVLQHHEKLNGRGYPMGVEADKISSYAKILAIADIYDALVTERPYKKAFSQQDAIEMIMAMTDELDITFMRNFLGIVILYPVNSIVTLSNGEKAKVLKNNPQYPLRPKVIGLHTGKVYDLSEDIKCASLIIE